MSHCIKESEFDPAIHVKISGPHTLEECQQICGQVGAQETKDCGCSGS